LSFDFSEGRSSASVTRLSHTGRETKSDHAKEKRKRENKNVLKKNL